MALTASPFGSRAEAETRDFVVNIRPLPSPSRKNLTSHQSRLARTVQDYLSAHYSEPISLKGLAVAFRFNACYISELFHRATGIGLHEYLEQLRMASAKKFLLDPRSRIAEVAQASGYASTDAFRHAFKAHEKVSPRAWRERESLGVTSQRIPRL